MNKPCHICAKPVLYGRKYCSEACVKIAKAASQMVIKQALKQQLIKEGRVCGRCKVLVHEPSMKKYCNKCSDIMSDKHYSKYEKVNKCKTCSTAIDGPHAKYCYKCADARKVVQIKAQTVRRREAKKKKPLLKPKESLPAWMLERGKISATSMRGMLG